MNDERITNGPQRIGEFFDFDALRGGLDALRAATAAQREEEARLRREAWARLSPAERHERRFRTLVDIGVGERVAWAASASPPGSRDEEPSEATQRVKEWAKSRIDRSGPWALGLLGEVGVGKSYAAARWVGYLLSTGVAVSDILWLRAVDLATIDIYRERDHLERLARRPYAVLDDLGAEYLDAGGAALAKFDLFIDIRSEANSDLLITGNITDLAKMAARYAGRFMDRVGRKSWVVLQDKRSRRS